MRAGPIPFTAIDRWATRSGIDEPDEFAGFMSAIRAMDAEWLGQQTANEAAADQPVVNDRPMSMPLFDALFSQ